MGKVVLAISHGYNSTPLFMKGVEHEFDNWGKFDQIINLSLYSLKWGFLPGNYNNSTPIVKLNGDSVEISETIVGYVLEQLKEKVDSDADEIIFLGHSMGGLVWRALYKAVIHEQPDTWLDRPSPEVKGIIQLATPNQGSRLTNMRLIGFFDKLHTSVILNIAGYSVKLINRLARFLGFGTSIDARKYKEDEDTTQIKQMKPGSRFLQWLNEDPTHVNEIPHYRAIGTKNSVFFTNLAWMEQDQEVPPEVMIKEILEAEDEVSDAELRDVIDKIGTDKLSDDEQIEELREFLEREEISDEFKNDISFVDQIRALFSDAEYEPNDGLVSIQDAELPGSILIDLGEHGKNISHYSIVMWFLPFGSYQHVRDQVFSIIETELLN